jgi:hypothetical protein
MKRLIPACALAMACAVTASAQDSTSTTRTQVKADDAKAVTATGCLVPGASAGSFALRGAITARGEEVTTKTRTKTDVDRDEARVRTETRTRAEGDRDRVGAGSVLFYNLSPRAGVDLAAHAGHQVQLTAIVLDRGEDDADVRIREETRVDREHGRDTKSRTESKVSVDRERGDGPRLTVISVKPLGGSCS